MRDCKCFKVMLIINFTARKDTVSTWSREGQSWSYSHLRHGTLATCWAFTNQTPLQPGSPVCHRKKHRRFASAMYPWSQSASPELLRCQSCHSMEKHVKTQASCAALLELHHRRRRNRPPTMRWAPVAWLLSAARNDRCHSRGFRAAFEKAACECLPLIIS